MTTGKSAPVTPRRAAAGAGEGKGSGRRPLEDTSSGLYKPREHSSVTASTALCPRGQPPRARPTALAAGGRVGSRNCEFIATDPLPAAWACPQPPRAGSAGGRWLGHQGPRCRAAGRRCLLSPPSTHSGLPAKRKHESDGGQCGRRRRGACAEGWHRDAGACKPSWGHRDGHCPLITPSYPRPPGTFCTRRGGPCPHWWE